MEPAPLGACTKISAAEYDKYIVNCLKMLQKATDHPDMYDYWSQWCLWYYDIILFSFFSVERPQMYEALNTALLERNISEAHRLINMCIKI